MTVLLRRCSGLGPGAGLRILCVDLSVLCFVIIVVLLLLGS